MPSPVPPLAQSESKKRFFERLRLDQSNPDHTRIYAMMKAEAIDGRSRIAASPEALIPSLRNDPTIEPPYSNSQIDELAIQREVFRIYNYARPETRPFYDLGMDMDRRIADNWVIRWMLWHVNRYRDHRNRNRTGPPRGRSESKRQEGQEDTAFATSAEGSPTSSERRPSGPISESPNEAQSGQRSGYWDPVRNV